MVNDEHTTPGEQPSERQPLLSQEAATNTAKRTPLPLGQLAILLYLRFCEAASIYSVFPFISQLLLSLAGGDEGKVAYYASIMDSVRYTISLVTAMYWSRMSDYLGRKPILLLGTAAIAISMLFLGMSMTFWALVTSRCIFAAFNSNGGTIKSAIGEMTDETNSADAFALLHVPWAVGSAIGPLIGGSLSNPHIRFPLIFSGKLWQDFPYLLPCATTTAVTALGFLILFNWFRETLPRRPTAALSSPTPISQSHPPPLHSLLTPRALLSISNYVALALSHMAYTALQPLFLAMPIPIGGLALQPSQIGYILSLYGLFNSIIQTFLLGPSIRRFGLRTVFKSAVSAFIPVFLLFPLMNIHAKDWYTRQSNSNSRYIMWALLVFQLGLLSVGELGYGCVYMYITSSAPSKRSLGSVNGVAQTAVSVARLVAPGVANMMLGVSIERGWMGGYAVYLVLSVLAGVGVVLAGRLPRGVWEAEGGY